MANDAKIRLTAEDATAAAFASVSNKFSSLGSEVAGLPAKFAQVAIAAAGIGSIAAFANMISSAIEAKARLRDLSVQSNISVEALAALGKVGKFSNTSLDDIAGASNKLSKALFSQTEDSKGAAQAIAALGLNFDQFKMLKPDEQMVALAKAFDGFADTGEKSAAAMLLFGRQGAQLLPFLKELAERGLKPASKETATSAEQAKRYEDNLKTLSMASDEWKKRLVNGILPALERVTAATVEAQRANDGLLGSLLGTVRASLGFDEKFTNTAVVAKYASELKEETAALQKLRDMRNMALLGNPPDLDAKITAAEQRVQAAKERFREVDRMLLGGGRPLLNSAAGGGRGFVNPAAVRPRIELPDAGGNPDADKDARALLRKQFEGQLKLINDFAEQQKDAYAFANQYLKNVYDDGVTSLADFFEKQHALRDAGLKAQLEAYDKTIAEAKAFKAKALKAQDRQDADNRIAHAEQGRAKAIQDASQRNILSAQEEAKAVKQLAYSYYDFLASLKTLQGDFAGASNLRIVKQVADAQELLTKVGFDPAAAKAQAEAYGVLLTRTEALSRAQTDYARLVEVAGLAEKNATLDAQASNQSEIETLKQIGAIRQGALGDLSKEVEQARQLAEALGTPEAKLFAAKLALQFKQAAAEADPLLMKTRELGQQMGQSLASSLENAIVEGKKFSDVVKEIEKNILHMLINTQFTKPLENWLSGAIGGNGQASGGGGILGKLFPGIFGAGVSGPGVGIGSGTGAEFVNGSFAGFFADGGTLQPGQWGIAGESGPERIYAGAQPLHVTPNGGAMVVHNHFTINGPMDRRSQDQIALAAMQGAQRAARRNG